jgi:hypothetical protein
MFFVFFGSLFLNLFLLIFYFTARDVKKRLSTLQYDLQKALDDKSNMEIKYNGILEEQKRAEKIDTKNKIDEMKLLFSKINTLDDKFNFFANEFKNNMDSVSSNFGKNTETMVQILENNYSILENNRKTLEDNRDSLNFIKEYYREDIEDNIEEDVEPQQFTEKKPDINDIKNGIEELKESSNFEIPLQTPIQQEEEDIDSVQQTDPVTDLDVNNSLPQVSVDDLDLPIEPEIGIPPQEPKIEQIEIEQQPQEISNLVNQPQMQQQIQPQPQDKQIEIGEKENPLEQFAITLNDPDPSANDMEDFLNKK